MQISELKHGMDFRDPSVRREVFLRFYEFHIKYRAHPGAVYYVFPYIFEKFNLTQEQKLWFCFINGISQHCITTYRLFSECPDLETLDFNKLSTFFRANYEKLGWDTDRRYVKNKFEDCVKDYLGHVEKHGSQEALFKSVMKNGDEAADFTPVWDMVMGDFKYFGRLSTFSYLEYLRIAGLPIVCNNLFLEDMSGSKSHRNGLCKVLGHDELDWHSSNPSFAGYSKEVVEWLGVEAKQLLEEARERISVNPQDVNYFTLESTLCCYKGWFRENRRYPNVYNDMFYERILRDEKMWGTKNEFFRQLRKDCIPTELRMEDNPKDPGLKPIKQNHFRNTGQVIMMDKEYECFKNDFNDAIKI